MYNMYICVCVHLYMGLCMCVCVPNADRHVKKRPLIYAGELVHPLQGE